MAKTPWDVDVYVSLESVANPQDPQFRIETCLPVADPTDPHGTIIFHNRRRPGFIIKFHFEDETGSGYRFPQDEDEAVWSQLGNSCPRSRPHQQVFEPRQVQANGRRLVVFNPNRAPVLGPFKYSLRVTNNGGVPLLLDPGGDNQNGQEF